MANHSPEPNGTQDDDQFTQVSQQGWNRFSRFLLINVLVTIAALLLIGAFTVWS